MFAMMIMLVAVSCFAEYKAVTSLPWLYKIMSSESVTIFGKKMNTRIVPLCFSMALSVLLGSMFGAAGLIVFVGGLCSTAVMQPVYTMMQKGTWTRLGVRVTERKVAARSSFEDNKNSIVDAYKGVVRIVHLCMIPVKIVIGIVGFTFMFIGDPKATMKKVFS